MIEVSIRGVDGSLITKIDVEPATTAAKILDCEALQLPAGFRARLVTQSAQALSPDTEIREPQAADLRPKLKIRKESNRLAIVAVDGRVLREQ